LSNNKPVLIVEKEPPLTWLKLNRPDVLNSLNRRLLKDLVDACQKIADDKETRVVAIIGSGKAFCAGADLSERKTMTEGEVLDYHALIQHTMNIIEGLPQPVIAAINGSAFGGGTELALACDLRVMMESAVLRFTEVKLGIIPGAGGTQRLPRLIGKSKAKEMILTSAALGAREGYELGLIHRLVPGEIADVSSNFNESLLAEVRSWARDIATSAPLALKMAKQAIDQGFDRDFQAGLALETKAYIQLINTKDRLEGLVAFAEKRPPVYQGE
jgi:enoyl-CoA hydratase/carnithine racemase